METINAASNALSRAKPHYRRQVGGIGPRVRTEPERTGPVAEWWTHGLPPQLRNRGRLRHAVVSKTGLDGMRGAHCRDRRCRLARAPSPPLLGTEPALEVVAKSFIFAIFASVKGWRRL